jgi:hypothetical protein
MPYRNLYSGPYISCEESKTWKQQHLPIRIHDCSLHTLYRALFDYVCSRVQRFGEHVRILFERPPQTSVLLLQMVEIYHIGTWSMMIFGADVAFFIADCLGQTVLVRGKLDIFYIHGW